MLSVVCLKTAGRYIDRIGLINDGAVDIHRQTKLYAFDVISKWVLESGLRLTLAEFAYRWLFRGAQSGTRLQISWRKLSYQM